MTDRMSGDSFRMAWNATCLQAGIPSLSRDTCARILAVLHVESGCTTAITLSPKLRADVRYIQERFGFLGGDTPDAAFVKLFNHYVREIDAYQRQAKRRPELSRAEQAWPEWARRLYWDSYNVKLTAVFVYSSDEEEQAALRAFSGRSRSEVL